MANPYVRNEGERTKGFCIRCAECYYFPVTAEQLARWQSGELIQNAMPHLAKADRELFVSGICGTCRTSLFGTLPAKDGSEDPHSPLSGTLA